MATTVELISALIDANPAYGDQLKPILLGLASGSGGGIESIVAGTNVSVDDTDPLNPVVSSSLPYKSYTALLTQNGSNDPGESYVYNNDLSGSISWSRSQAGLYIGTLAGAFPDASKCAIILGAPSSQNSLLNSVWQSADTVAIYTLNNTTGVQADDLMNAQVIEIRVYN